MMLLESNPFVTGFSAAFDLDMVVLPLSGCMNHAE